MDVSDLSVSPLPLPNNSMDDCKWKRIVLTHEFTNTTVLQKNVSFDSLDPWRLLLSLKLT